MIAAELRGGNKPSLNDALGWIGSRVDDIYGTGVGRLEDVWIDPGTGAPKWLLVKEGRFGGRTTLIPFEDATAGAGHVWIPYERDVVRDAPAVTPGAPLTQAVESSLRAHYAGHSARSAPRQPTQHASQAHTYAPPSPGSQAHAYQAAQQEAIHHQQPTARRPLPPSPQPVPVGAPLPPRPSQLGRSQLAAVSGATAPRHLTEQAASLPPQPRSRSRAMDPRLFQPRQAGPVPPLSRPGQPPALEHEGPPPGQPEAHYPAPHVPQQQYHHTQPHYAQPEAPPAPATHHYAPPVPEAHYAPPQAPQQPPAPHVAPAPQAPRLRPAPTGDDQTAVAIPLIHGLDQPYRVEIALEGEIRVSGELKSFSIQPVVQPDEHPADSGSA
jgi:sporulation protein YlmC with PRC-barrel domain